MERLEREYHHIMSFKFDSLLKEDDILIRMSLPPIKLIGEPKIVAVSGKVIPFIHIHATFIVGHNLNMHIQAFMRLACILHTILQGHRWGGGGGGARIETERQLKSSLPRK